MSEKEKNTETKETTKNKKGLKIALITLLIVVVIAGASVGGYFGYKYYSENKSTGTEWGDIYFNYLNNESNNENPFSINKYKDTKVGFIDEGKENPIMFVTGNWTIASTDGSTETTKYVDLYEINEDNKVTYMGGLGIITYQNSSNKDVLPLPTFNIFTNLYLKFRIAKVLNVELGADATFFSKYYEEPPGYPL